jgi:acyl-CoA reductase-like NAD-dependent aldehyde dehydrogenase
MASPSFPEPPPAVPATPLAEVDALVARLADRKDAWVKTGIERRLELLRRCVETTVASGPAWVAAACRAKGIPEGSPTAGEEWLGGPVTTVRNIRKLIDALEKGGAPVPPEVRTRPDGQAVARVFPASPLDKLMLGGVVADVWIEPGRAPSQGRIYRDKKAGKFGPGKVGLVLGAGNVASIGPMDALYKIFVEDEVVVLKTNPVNAYLGEHWERALRPLVDEGLLGVVHGGAEVGAHLTAHPRVDTLHMTGSDRTHDAIVWGRDPEEQKRRKAANDPVITKPISSELGSVTPVLVVPGDWSEADIAFQARHVAAMVANNASFNCNAAKALVVAKGWAQRDAFVSAVRDALRRTPPRKAYYPGAQDRYRGFVERYPDAEKLGEGSSEVVPWTILPSVKPQADEHALTQEAFCGVLGVVDLDASDARSFIDAAVPFANDVMWGTLSCMVLIHPETERQNRAAFDRAIAELRFGGIGINVWAGVIYGLVVTSWGAFPGHPLDDIRSGRGVVHNAYLFDHPQKSVVRAPFRMSPTPAWFTDHKAQDKLGEALMGMEANPGWLKLPRLIAAAVRG